MNPFPQSGYRWPIRPDTRNFPLERAQLPQPFPDTYKTDISHIPVFNQLKIPDCVENAITTVKLFHEWENIGKLSNLSRRSLVIPTVQKDNFPLENGTSVENALYVAHKQGICEAQLLSDDHTLSIDQFINPIAYFPSAQANALTHTVYSYAFVTDLSVNGLKNAIYQNGVIIVGALINQNWWTAADGRVSWSKADIYPIRAPATHSTMIDSTLSGHCFVLYGYDGDGFYLRNSFGDTWGDGGNNYFTYDFLPFIYEAATIIDLSIIQIEALKQAQADANAVQVAISNLDPHNPLYAQILTVLTQVIDLISQYVKSIFS